MKPFVVALLAALAVAGLSAAEKPVELLDIRQQPHTPLAVSDRKAAVLFFVSPFCPTSNAFTPEINRIAADYTNQFAFYLVEADADISTADAQKHAETLEIQAPVLLDPAQVLARRTGAKTTPEAVVLAADGRTLYQGRINNLYATQTKKLKEPTVHDLRAALDAIAAGQPVATPATKAIGCSIALAP